MTNKHILITGASQGLGFELVKKSIECGYTVFALDKIISEDLLKLSGNSVYIICCDITNDEQINNCFNQIIKITDSIDIIVNCAGIWLDYERKRLKDSYFQFDIIFKQFEVNTVGALRMLRYFIPLSEKSSGKTIINISSEAGSIENCWRKGEYGYCMSKAALNMACKIIKNDYPDLKIYAVHPGWMKTPQGYRGATKDASPNQKPSDTAADLIKLAEEDYKGYIFCDHKGEKINW